MNTAITQLAALFFLVFFACHTTKAQSAEEHAVRECALNYLEGWYSADTARMAKALSPDLSKKGFLVHPNTGELTVAPASYDQMLQWVGQKANQMAENPDIKMEVHIIEVGVHIAMVKTVTPDFIDYLQLARMDGQWKIYHAVWERPPKE